MEQKSLIIFTYIICTAAISFAQTGTVEKIKGTKAVVQFEENVPVGTKVTVQDEFSDFESEKPSKQNKYTRQSNFYFTYESVDYKLKIMDSEASLKKQMYEVGYLYNFGYYELGLGTSFTNDESLEDKVSTVSLIGHYNFIKNSSKNNFVPYLFLHLTNYTEIAEVYLSSVSLKMTGNQMGVGFLFYPFNELFAFDLSYIIQTNMTGKYKSDDLDIDEKVKFTGHVIRLGYRLSY